MDTTLTNIRFMVLYGSRAEGTAHSESDFDVAIYLEPEHLQHFDFHAYEKTLEEVESFLKVGIEKIDLSVLNTANILHRYEITSKGKLLFGDTLAYLQYCAFAYRDYVDAKPLFDLEGYMIEKRQALFRQHAA